MIIIYIYIYIYICTQYILNNTILFDDCDDFADCDDFDGFDGFDGFYDFMVFGVFCDFCDAEKHSDRRVQPAVLRRLEHEATKTGGWHVLRQNSLLSMMYMC